MPSLTCKLFLVIFLFNSCSGRGLSGLLRYFETLRGGSVHSEDKLNFGVTLPNVEASIKSRQLSGSSPITYKGGEILYNPITIYPVWYGSWKKSQKHIIRRFIGSLSDPSMVDLNGSVAEWWNTVQLYYDSLGNYVSGSVSLGTEVDVGIPFGDGSSNPVGRDQFVQAATDSVSSGNLPNDLNGIYLILSSADIIAGDFCTLMCGWHTYSGSGKYAWVGDSGVQCPGLCGFAGVNTPNGDPGVDAMVSVIAHELSETSSDPFLDSWISSGSSSGGEAADMCSTNFGNVIASASGIEYNVEGSNGTRFLIQTVMDPVTLECTLGSAPPSAGLYEPLKNSTCGVASSGIPCNVTSNSAYSDYP